MSWDIEDRLELARRLRYRCGDRWASPERAGVWFEKPIRNPAGMGLGARPNRYDGAGRWARPLGDGAMWMPMFRGTHLSVDFQRRRGGAWRQRLTVRCEYDPARARPARWVVAGVQVPVPEPLRAVETEWLNVELIGGRAIEAHGRRNTDFDPAPPGATVARVVWADQRPPQAYVRDFDDADGQLAVPRLGFMYL